MTRALLAAGLLLAAATVALALLGRRGEEKPRMQPPPAPTAAPEVEPEPEPEPPPIPELEPPWRGAGAFLWNETSVDPTLLAETMREHGFDWIAIRLHDGLEEDPVADDWIERFRRAGGPHVGGWGVLRERPTQEAALAAASLRRHGLGFYVANAEAEYGSGGDPSRSAAFVARFRREFPAMPAALSSLCRPDPSFDLATWAAAGFAFLPQAYVNQFGGEVAPANCVAAAARTFPAESVHPTVGSYVGAHEVEPLDYARLLDDAGTVGFSVYLAETEMPAEAWAAYGRAIAELGIAA